MKKYKRVFVLVIDSLGIGQDDTSKNYGDINVDLENYYIYQNQ